MLIEIPVLLNEPDLGQSYLSVRTKLTSLPTSSCSKIKNANIAPVRDLLFGWSLSSLLGNDLLLQK